MKCSCKPITVYEFVENIKEEEEGLEDNKRIYKQETSQSDFVNCCDIDKQLLEWELLQSIVQKHKQIC